MPATRTRAAKPKTSREPAPRMSLAEVMRTLEKAGTAQTKKTYARHGATEPMFGVLFATLGTLVKKIGVDHDLALALWDTNNFDARNLAFKIVDPTKMTGADLDRWAKGTIVRMCEGYVSMIALESSRGLPTATRWLASSDEKLRSAGWGLVSQLAMRDEATPDAWFSDRLDEIGRTIHASPNAIRAAMNHAMIAIGGRSATLKRSALATAKRVGKVEVDHGDTSCKTPEAGPYIEKMWSRAKSGGFESPAAQERGRESPRTRC